MTGQTRAISHEQSLGMELRLEQLFRVNQDGCPLPAALCPAAAVTIRAQAVGGDPGQLPAMVWRTMWPYSVGWHSLGGTAQGPFPTVNDSCPGLPHAAWAQQHPQQKGTRLLAADNHPGLPHLGA